MLITQHNQLNSNNTVISKMISLREFGYRACFNADRRNTAIVRAIKAHGFVSVYERLSNVFALQNSSPSAKVMAEDLAWLREKYMPEGQMEDMVPENQYVPEEQPVQVDDVLLENQYVPEEQPVHMEDVVPENQYVPMLSLSTYGYSTKLPEVIRLQKLDAAITVHGIHVVIARLRQVSLLCSVQKKLILDADIASLEYLQNQAEVQELPAVAPLVNNPIRTEIDLLRQMMDNMNNQMIKILDMIAK